MTREQRFFLLVSLRLAIVWVVLTALVLTAGRQLTQATLPLLDLAVNVMQDDFTATLAVVRQNADWAIQMQPLTVRPIAMTDRVRLRRFLSLQPYWTHVDHTLVPVVLLLTGVLAWPLRTLRELGVRLLLGVPALLAVIVLSAPVLLIGQVQLTLMQLATRAGAASHEPWMVTLMIFMESGGRWLLPIAAAVACIAGARAWFGPPPPAVPPAPAAPPRADPSGPPAFPPVSGA
jgi:hypothetical protein